MSTDSTSASNPQIVVVRDRSGCFGNTLKGCLAIVLVLALLGGGAYGYRRYGQWQAERAAQKTRLAESKKFDEVINKWAKSGDTATPGKPPYDIDKTIRVMHEMDLAMKNRANFQDFLGYALSIDPRGVDPEVLKERAKVLAVLKEIYVRQRTLDENDNLWLNSSEFFLGVLDTFKVDLSPTGLGFGFDKDEAEKRVSAMRERQEKAKTLKKEIFDKEWGLFEAVSGYASTYYARVEEWDRLCVQRDRAYLAAADGNWPVAEQAARAAIALAPLEKEAHILLAQSLIEQGGETRWLEATGLLNTFISEHPAANAPALLLLGVLQQKQGRNDEARLTLQQAVAYYPKQAALLTDMLDPYKMRDFLRKTREGSSILQGYKSTMLGAGYYSPDLQLANLNFALKNNREAETKVFEHFYRRRLQNEWDYILSDIDFCYDYLGTDFYLIYPEDSYLDLEVKPNTFSRTKLSVGVVNRSDKTLHNASLILCLHFTDMIPGDYVTLEVGRTLPAILPNQTTDFGDLNVDVELFGTHKTPRDIVAVRAILVSQEAVVWVDSEPYRIAEAEEFRSMREAGEPTPKLDLPWLDTLQSSPESLKTGVLKEVEAKLVEKRFGGTRMELELPRELAMLRPIFRLMVDGKPVSPTTNTLQDDDIKLIFDKLPSKVGNIDLSMVGPFADLLLKLRKDGDTYTIDSVNPTTMDKAPKPKSSAGQ